MESSGKNTGVGCHALLQRIFSTQWSSQVSCIETKESLKMDLSRLFFHLHVKYGFVRLTSYKVLKCEADLKMEYNQWKYTHTYNQYKNINAIV